MKKVRLAWAVLLIVLIAHGAFSQNQSQHSQSSTTPEYVEEKGFKTKVFAVQHRDPNDLLQVLKTLGSGFKGAQMAPSREFKTITVRDFPENLATIEEALKRLDQPKVEAPSSTIELTIQILVASSGGTASSDYPPSLNDVIKQLQTALKYKSYGLMASAIHRTTASSPETGRTGSIDNSGVAEPKLFDVITPNGNPIFYDYRVQGITLDTPASGVRSVGAMNFHFSIRVPVNLGKDIQYQNVGFNSPITLREGDKIVVGTTTVGDKGLIVVLSAKVLK